MSTDSTDEATHADLIRGAAAYLPHRTVGHGPKTVFLLHGWLGSADGWGLFPRLS